MVLKSLQSCLILSYIWLQKTDVLQGLSTCKNTFGQPVPCRYPNPYSARQTPDGKSPSRVEATSTGLIPGWRVWTLKAFDEDNNLIVEDSKDYNSWTNVTKYQAFVSALKKKGYTLTKSQEEQLASALALKLGEIGNAVGGIIGWQDQYGRLHLYRRM